MPVKISGKVTKGKGKGKKIGFPTVNIEIGEEIESGVYAGRATVKGKSYRAGIFVSPDGRLLEAHLVGFSGDLYGKEVKVTLARKIREVMKFESDEELKKQIKEDIEFVKNKKF